MSPLFRLLGMARPQAALAKPICNKFFSTATPKRPLPLNFFRQPSASWVSRARQARASSSGGFGPERRYQANMVIVKGLIGVNVAVFAYGTYALAQAREGHTANYIKFMRNMSMNVLDVKAGYYWQILTSVFTHRDIFHIGANLFTFWYMGRSLAAMPITPGHFMTIVIGSGLAGSIYYLFDQYQKLQNRQGNPKVRGLGFSGALLGVTTVLACFQPRATIGLFGVIPVPLGVLVLGYAAYDGYYLNSQSSHTAHAGHLGGLAFGLGYYFLKLRGLRYPGSI